MPPSILERVLTHRDWVELLALAQLEDEDRNGADPDAVLRDYLEKRDAAG